jgi:hypothetical protein
VRWGLDEWLRGLLLKACDLGHITNLDRACGAVRAVAHKCVG